MRKNCHLFLLFLVLCITGCAKDEEVMTGTILGFVSDITNANAPIAGASVTINSKGLTKTTGSDGRFEFTGLEPGTYSISITANEYQPTTKQVTVYAGQTANCDVQLETGKVSVDIDPINLIFGKDVEQASFSISNKANRQLNYSISNYPDYIQVSPTTGIVAAKGKQAVSVSVINRKSITETRNGQLTVNIGSDSYIVSFSVEAYTEETMNVEISPRSLSFDKNTEQLSFTIANNNSKSHEYSITNYPDYIQISPTTGTVAAKGIQTIGVSVVNRKSITEAKSGQITANIGKDSYIVSFSIEAYQEEALNVDIYPKSLSFDKNTEQLTFTITNNNSKSHDFKISSNLSILSVSPTSGTITSRGQRTITISVNDRKSVDEDRTGTVTIEIEGSTFAVPISVAKYSNGGSPGGGTTTDVTRGLQAYYNFDNGNADDGIGNNHGYLDGGTFIDDTPNSSGKALMLKSKESVRIGTNMIQNKRNYSISFWVKDFGEGPLFRTSDGGTDDHNFSPTIFVSSSYELNYATRDNASCKFSVSVSNLSSGKWNMITIVTSDTDPNRTTCPADNTLYINGRKVETIHDYGQSTGTTMQIGGAAYTNFTAGSYLRTGYWADAFKIDNLRIYSVSLSDDEVAAIYDVERK